MYSAFLLPSEWEGNCSEDLSVFTATLGKSSCGALIAAPVGALGRLALGARWCSAHHSSGSLKAFAYQAVLELPWTALVWLSTEPGVQYCHRESYRTSVKNMLVPATVGEKSSSACGTEIGWQARWLHREEEILGYFSRSSFSALCFYGAVSHSPKYGGCSTNSWWEGFLTVWKRGLVSCLPALAPSM